MATGVPGSILVDVRGKIAQQVYTRSPAGLIIRERVDPAQPASDERDLRQAAMTALSQAWSGTLSGPQRSTWRQYGRQHLLPDRFGRPKPASGICHFIRSNVQRYRTEAAITAPIAPVNPPPPMPGFSFTVQVAAALEVTGALNPDVTGVYSMDGTFRGHPTWKLAGQNWWIYHHAGPNFYFLSSDVPHPGGNYWYRTVTPNGAFSPAGGATGNATAAWDPTHSAVELTMPPATYPAPPADMELFAYAGIQINQGRDYYRTPFRYIGSNEYAAGAWTVDPWLVPHYNVLTSPGRLFLRLVAALDDGATSTNAQAHANF